MPIKFKPSQKVLLDRKAQKYYSTFLYENYLYYRVSKRISESSTKSTTKNP